MSFTTRVAACVWQLSASMIARNQTHADAQHLAGQTRTQKICITDHTNITAPLALRYGIMRIRHIFQDR
jgi:hypothetical protein